MTKIRETLVTALAGIFGLPLDARELWPDIILGGFLAWALIFFIGLAGDTRFRLHIFRFDFGVGCDHSASEPEKSRRRYRPFVRRS